MVSHKTPRSEKGKEKMIDSVSQKFFKSYSTRESQKKLLHEAMAANKASTTQHKRKRKAMVSKDKSVQPKDLVNISQQPENSSIDLDDIVGRRKKSERL